MHAESINADRGQSRHLRFDHDHDNHRHRGRDDAGESEARRGHGHGRAFEISLSPQARELFRQDRDDDHRHGMAHRVRDVLGDRAEDGPRMPFGRFVAAFVREGMQALARLAGLDGKADGNTGTGTASIDTNEADGDAVASQPAAKSAVGQPASPDTAAAANASSGDDILDDFSQRLTQLLRHGLQTMFHLLGFGDKPTETAPTSTDTAAPVAAGEPIDIAA